MFKWFKRIRAALSPDHYAEGVNPKVGHRIDGTPFARADGSPPVDQQGGQGAVARTPRKQPPGGGDSISIPIDPDDPYSRWTGGGGGGGSVTPPMTHVTIHKGGGRGTDR